MAQVTSSPTSITPATAVEGITFIGSGETVADGGCLLCISDTKSELFTLAGIEKVIQRFIKLYMS